MSAEPGHAAGRGMIDPGVIGLSLGSRRVTVEGLGWTDLGEPERVFAALKVKLESAADLVKSLRALNR